MNAVADVLADCLDDLAECDDAAAPEVAVVTSFMRALVEARDHAPAPGLVELIVTGAPIAEELRAAVEIRKAYRTSAGPGGTGA